MNRKIQELLQPILNAIPCKNVGSVKYFSNMDKNRLINTNVEMPDRLPSRQSGFYMPLISEAYLMAVESKDREKTFKFKLTKTNIPEWITKSKMTSRNGLFIPVKLYNQMVKILSYSFKDKLQEIQGYYDVPGETLLTFQGCGHISGGNQVKLIDEASYEGNSNIIIVIFETFIFSLKLYRQSC